MQSQHTVFWVGLLFLRSMHLGLSQDATCAPHLFLSPAEWYSIVWSVWPLVERQLGCFQFLTIVNRAIMSLCTGFVWYGQNCHFSRASENWKPHTPSEHPSCTLCMGPGQWSPAPALLPHCWSIPQPGPPPTHTPGSGSAPHPCPTKLSWLPPQAQKSP